MFADSCHPASWQECCSKILSNVSVQVNSKLKVKIDKILNNYLKKKTQTHVGVVMVVVGLASRSLKE
jgi:hypothetical protein